jgi:putative acetyltransferase
MHITPDDLSGPDIRALLETHFAGMLASSPKDSCHFLDFEGLKAPGVQFWSIWDDSAETLSLAGCGALRALGATHGEIKSMRTHDNHLRMGAGAQMLAHIIGQARAMVEFEPALALYRRFGFAKCPPFGDYILDPFSVYMTRNI